jgi:hypothetical protein
MSAMSDIDLMLQEYEAARVRLTHAVTIEAFHAAVDHVLRQGDVLAKGLRSILTANSPKGQ